jgi:hypothetical protein
MRLRECQPRNRTVSFGDNLIKMGKVSSSGPSCQRQVVSVNSGYLHRSVVVAMVTMGMVQSSVHEVIDMIPVGHTFVPAGRAMHVCAARLWRTPHRIGITDLDHMLVNMIIMHMMKMPIMKIVDVVLVPYCCMSAIRTVPVSMVLVLFLATSGHRAFSFFLSFSIFADGRERKIKFLRAQRIERRRCAESISEGGREKGGQSRLPLQKKR